MPNQPSLPQYDVDKICLDTIVFPAVAGATVDTTEDPQMWLDTQAQADIAAGSDPEEDVPYTGVFSFPGTTKPPVMRTFYIKRRLAATNFNPKPAGDGRPADPVMAKWQAKPEVPVPVRALLTNEKLTNDFGGHPYIQRTDLLPPSTTGVNDQILAHISQEVDKIAAKVGA